VLHYVDIEAGAEGLAEFLLLSAFNDFFDQEVGMVGMLTME
jgi:hypothetical protein